MTRMSRRSMFLGLGFAAISLGCGANPFLIPGLFSGGRESRVPAEFALKPQPRQSDVKVVILVSSKTGALPSDLIGVDRMLNAELITILDTRCRENEEKVLILKMPRIDEYKADHVNWRTIRPYDIGKELGADYVIDVEIAEMDLFKPGSRNDWLQGHATVAVNAYDLHKPLKEASYKYDYNTEYPQGREMEVESPAQVSAFRRKFVERIASDISMKFTTSTLQRRID
jgi:hypothetical protein